MNELVEIQKQQIASWESPAVLQARIDKMKDLMKRVMKKDTHYGIVPGCKKPSLWQPGQQLLSVAFKIGYEPEVERVETDDGHITYRTKTRVFDQVTGITLGYGIGECSSAEEKYAWKRCYIQEEFDETPIEQRRVKYSEYQGKVQKTNQIRTNPADVANTILKMSAKRSKIAGCLDVVAASEVFTQDIEDLPPGMDLEDGETKPVNPKAAIQEPIQTGQTANPEAEFVQPDDETRKANKWISSKQEGRLYGLCKQFNVNPKNVKQWFRTIKKNANVHLCHITWAGKPSEYDKICETIEKQPKFYDKYAMVQGPNKAPDPVKTPEGPTPREAFEISVEEFLVGENLGNEFLDAQLQAAGFSGIKGVPEGDFSKFIAQLQKAL